MMAVDKVIGLGIVAVVLVVARAASAQAFLGGRPPSFRARNQ
jgi:hypothetical protein